MQFKYIALIAIALTGSRFATAQTNTPNLSATSASGAVTSMATPTEVSTPVTPNIVNAYAPFLPITDAASLSTTSPASDTRQQVTYSDGFNRPFQVITKNVATIGTQSQNRVQIYDSRVQQNQYNFLPFSSASGDYHTTAFQEQRDYYAALFPNEGYTSFSQSQVISNGANRAEAILMPGKSQVGQSRGTVTKRLTNSANEIIIWNIDASGLPLSGGYYPAGELFGTETDLPTSALILGSTLSAPSSKVYKDRDGKVIVSMVADSSYSVTQGLNQVAGITFKKTYYVYGEKGQLLFILPPKLTQAFEANNGTFTSTSINNLSFQYQYDNLGRAIASRKPGEHSFTWVVYDRKNRVVMKQTPNEAGNNEWEVVFYDPQNRVKATSVYQDPAGLHNQAWYQNKVDTWTGGGTGDLYYYLSTATGEPLYPTDGAITGNTMMAYSYYDNYDVADPGDGAWATYSSQLQFSELITTGSAETPVKAQRTEGKVTGTLVKILPSQNADPAKVGDWRNSVMFYDDKGRVIYTVANDLYQNNPIHTQLTGSQYDFTGRVLITKHLMINNNSLDGTTQHIELVKSQFDDNSGALVKSIHKVDNGDWVTLSSLIYDGLGRVVRKTQGNGGEVQDYTYNMLGQPIGINGVYAETGQKGGVSKTFGESLKFDFGFSQPRYDNRISGMVWRGSSATNMYAYGYDYTQDGALKRADFNAYNGSWSNTSIDYSVSNLFYDKNGNILSMNQRGVNPASGPTDMDKMQYTYENSGMSNHLAQIDDNGVADYGAGDFQDGNHNVDYNYDGDGNLTSDNNKGISGMQYTRFDKPAMLSISNSTNNGTVEYTYDAAGNKIQEIISDHGSGQTKVTDYVGNFIYQNDNLQYILTSEGRTIIDPSTSVPREEYFIKDHLGNIRSVIDVTNYVLHDYLATYELASANLEDLVFDNLDDIRDIRPGGDGDNTMAANLNGGDTHRTIGSSLLVHVMAGDKVSMNVSTLYNGYDATQDAPLSSSAVMNSIISTLTGGVGGIGTSESHNTKVVSEVFNPTNYNSYNDLVSVATDPSKPKAYLNYVLFDENMQLVREMSGAFQASGEGDWQQIGTNTALEIPKNGYLAVYLSNTSVIAHCSACADVYFDQLLVQLSHGNLLEENHYYPHGLPIKNLGSVTTDPSYQENRRKYQANEYITGLGLNWMDFGARQYDPQIGRFLGVDPLAAKGVQEMYSPYAAMGNMPESNIDPNGEQNMLSYINASPKYLSTRRGFSEGVGGSGLATGGVGLSDNFGTGDFADFGNSGSGTAIVITGEANIAAFFSQISGGATINQIATNFASTADAGNSNSNGYNTSGLTSDGEIEITFHEKKSFFGKIWGGIKSGVSDAWDWAKNGVNSALVKGDHAANSLGDWFGANVVTNPVTVGAGDYLDRKMGKHTDPYMGDDGLHKNGIPTMTKTVSVLATAVSFGTYGAFIGTAAWGTGVTTWNTASLAVGYYNTVDGLTDNRAPGDNFMNSNGKGMINVGAATDLGDAVQGNPFGIYNFGVRTYNWLSPKGQ